MSAPMNAQEGENHPRNIQRRAAAMVAEPNTMPHHWCPPRSFPAARKSPWSGKAAVEQSVSEESIAELVWHKRLGIGSPAEQRDARSNAQQDDAPIGQP